MEHCMWTPGTNLAVITRNGVIVLENPANGLGAEFWTLLEEGVVSWHPSTGAYLRMWDKSGSPSQLRCHCSRRRHHAHCRARCL